MHTAHAVLEAAPETVHWGYFDSNIPSKLTVSSGDVVCISTVSGAPVFMPPAPYEVPVALRDIHATHTPKLPGHICTGPVEIRGAEPGHVLQVDILSVTLSYSWAYAFIRPLLGALPDDFENEHIIHLSLDRTRMTARPPWGGEIPLRPFFGVMAVAPPKEWGALSTIPPRRNGGNLDNKELIAGTTLLLPVFTRGASFSVGDGHAAQGDGEVCVTAVETGLVGSFRLTVRDDISLPWPMAETPTHFITMGFDPDLDMCVQIALRQMIDLIVARTKLRREEAYMLCSFSADVRVTQVVNLNKGAHVMLSKTCLDF